MRVPGHFSYLKSYIDTFLAGCDKNKKNVFVMMRYEEKDQYTEIEQVIKTSLNRQGLAVHLAKDHQFVPGNLWDNICVYMLACVFGIAIFEEIDK